jgi:hypothetical protein
MEGKKLGTFPKFTWQSFAEIYRELFSMGLLPIDFKSKIGPTKQWPDIMHRIPNMLMKRGQVGFDMWRKK